MEEVEDSDDDSFVRITLSISGKALLEYQNEGHVLDTPRVRKHTLHQKQIPFPVASAGAVARRRGDGIEKGATWWPIGNVELQMPGKGETNPLYAKLFNKTKAMATIEAFAAGNPKRNDSRPPGDYQDDRDECLTYINNRMGRPESQAELDEKCTTFTQKESENALRKWYKSTEIQVQTELNLLLLKNKKKSSTSPFHHTDFQK